MRIRSASPFWPLKDGLISNHPALKQSLSCDVAIVGGGLTGSMVGYRLAEAGVDTVILDKRDIGLGSTAASTALVLYEVDMHLTELMQLRGERDAVASYKLSLESIGKIERMVGSVGVDCGFRRKKGLYLASTKGEADALREEYAVRRQHGFRLDYLDRDEIAKNFSFSRPAALLSHDAAELDPYLLTYALIDHSKGRGLLRAYDRTAVAKCESTDRGVTLTTDAGFRVNAGKVVFATGYETTQFLRRRVVKLKSTYAMVSEPIPALVGWGYDGCLIWEASRPYFYIRTTRDGRMMVGGEDEDFVNPTRRDRLIPEKTRGLLRMARRMFPRMDIEVAYAWAGTFGETDDSLPYIGEVDEFPNAYFALCYGANGTNFGLMASEIIRDMYLGRPNDGSRLFRFGR